jgi:MATE family multidrug resistance protein
MISIVGRHEDLKKWDIFRNWWRLDRASVKGILRLGTPTGFIVLSETSMFAIVSLMLGVFGAAALAASAISFQVTSIAFMLPLAVGQAALVRTGRAAGAEDISALRQTGRAAMTLAVGSGLVNMLVILIFREQLAELFLASSDGLVEQVVVLAIPMLIITALFQIPEALQAVTIALLRGMNDTFWPALISMAGYWVVGVGLAWVFGFTLGLGPTAVWGAIGIALVLNGLIMVSRWFWQLRRIATDGSILRN